MDLPTEDLLTANGLVQLQHAETCKFVCSVCPIDDSFVGWKEHMEHELHIRNLEQFNLNFKRNGATGICCKLCNVDLDRDEVKIHGKSHLIVPWHEPENKYRTFFENRIIGWKNAFYCCLCDIIFVEWSMAILHIGDQTHRILVEEQTPLSEEFFSQVSADSSYESLVNNALVPFDEKTLECRICDINKSVQFGKIDEHVKSFLHTWDKITFDPRAKTLKGKIRECFRISCPMIDESDSASSGQEKPCEDSPCYYLEKLDDFNFRCNVCDCLVAASSANTKIHVGGTFHANSLNKYGCENISLTEGGTYHCQRCKCDISGLEKLYLHIKNVYHSVGYKLSVTILSEILTNILDAPSEVKTPRKSVKVCKPESPRLTDYYIAKLSETESRCKVCGWNVSASPADISLHLSGGNHASALKKYGCDKISKESENVFYCRSCARYIFGRERLYAHFSDSKHINSAIAQAELSQVGEAESAMEVDVPKPAEPEVPKIVYRPPVSHYYIRKPRPPKPLEPLYPNIARQTIPSNYIKRRYLADSSCGICNINLSTSTEIDDHIVAADHKNSINRYGCDNVSWVAGNLYWCRSCNCRIFGDDNVFSHVKGRYHAMENMAELSRQKKLEETKAAPTTPQPEPTKVALSSIMTSEVTKMVEEVRAREASLALSRHRQSNNNRARGPQAPRIITDARNPCNVCNVIFNSCAELHTHLASHFSGDFVSSVVDKNSNFPTVDRTTNIEKISSLQLTSQLACQESTETGKSSHKKLENCGTNDDNMNYIESLLNNNPFGDEEFFCCGDDDCSDISDSESSQRKRRTPRKKIMQRVVQLLDFDKDYIYDMKDKLREIELGMKLCLMTEATSIYCLVCRRNVENTLQDYFDHLRSLDHCDYLEKMEKDHELFANFPEQFSELELAYEYMEERSDAAVRCLVCREEVANNDDEIADHIDEKRHERICKEMRANGQINFESVKSRLHCDWYNVQKYWCVLCSADCETEISFVKHLESPKHTKAVNESNNDGRALIYDFCAPCALLWFGYRCTYAYHCNVPSHKWYKQDGHYVFLELPETAKSLLAAPEEYIEETLEIVDSIAADEREKEERVTRDFESAVKRRFYSAKAHPYGSRVSGFATADSDMDVFLDCGNMYSGNSSSKDQLLILMNSVHQCLSELPESWVLVELLTNCRTPIIRTNHIATGLSCDVSLKNGLSVENTKLIKSFNDVYPPCRKLIVFLKKWLTLCKLSGSDRISNYALYWCVIFYLQKEAILPSIATLTRMNSRSHEIAGWEVGITREFCYNRAESNYSIKELLARFFMFYADFDFRRDVVCPLLGDALEKRDFADHRKLPKDMRPYIDYMKRSGDAEPLRIDSPMCVQDPLNLQHNITKAVNKVYLSRFRTCCSKSVDILFGAS